MIFLQDNKYVALGIRFCLVTLTGIIVMEVPNFNSLMSLIGNLLKGIDNSSGATPARTLSISGLKSRVLTLPFLT